MNIKKSVKNMKEKKKKGIQNAKNDNSRIINFNG